MASKPDWTLLDVLIALAAVWGAGLSTFEAIARRRDKHPNVEVTASIGVPPDANDGIPRMVLFARSRSAEEVHLVGAGLFFPNSFWRHTPWRGPQQTWRVVPWEAPAPVPRVTYPYTLPAGRSVRDVMDLRQIARDLEGRGDSGKVQVRGFFAAEAGYMYSSKPLVFDIDQWKLPWRLALPPRGDSACHQGGIQPQAQRHRR